MRILRKAKLEKLNRANSIGRDHNRMLEDAKEIVVAFLYHRQQQLLIADAVARPLRLMRLKMRADSPEND